MPHRAPPDFIFAVDRTSLIDYSFVIEWKYTWSFSSCPKQYVISCIIFDFAVIMCSCPKAFVFLCQTPVRLTGWFTISPLPTDMFTGIINLNRTPSFYIIGIDSNPCATVVCDVIHPERENTVFIWFWSTNSFACCFGTYKGSRISIEIMSNQNFKIKEKL